MNDVCLRWLRNGLKFDASPCRNTRTPTHRFMMSNALILYTTQCQLSLSELRNVEAWKEGQKRNYNVSTETLGILSKFLNRIRKVSILGIEGILGHRALALRDIHLDHKKYQRLTYDKCIAKTHKSTRRSTMT